MVRFKALKQLLDYVLGEGFNSYMVRFKVKGRYPLSVAEVFQFLYGSI